MTSLAEPAPGHEPRVRRFQRGMTPIRPSRPLYGTRLRCGCGGLDVRINRAPSAGGRSEAEVAYRAHLAEQENPV